MIRESINNCTEMIIEAEKRGIKSKEYGKLPVELQKNMQEQVKNCLVVLQDVKRAEERGDVYRPPEPITLHDLKRSKLGVI